MICSKCGSDVFSTTVLMKGGDQIELKKCKNCGKIIQNN